MVAPSPTNAGSHRPFDALDTEGAALCRRHRRPPLITNWARQQPALADVTRLADAIPPAGIDRRPRCQALAALAPPATTSPPGTCSDSSFSASSASPPCGVGSSGYGHRRLGGDRPRRAAHRPPHRHPHHREHRGVAAPVGRARWSAVADATRRGALSNETARVVVLHAAGHSLPELARRTGTSRATVYSYDL